MPVSEILDDMRQFDFPIESCVLKTPKTAEVMEIFSFLLHELYGDAIQHKLKPVDDNSVEGSTDPELYDMEITSTFHLHRAIRDMFEDACYVDFNLYDITQPDSKRFRYQISALLNFAKYRRSRLEILDELAAGESETSNRHHELIQGNEKLSAEIGNIEQSRRDEEPLVEEHKKAVAELNLQLKHLNEERLALTKDTQSVKDNHKNLKDKLSHLEESITRSRLEVSSNKQFIVTSPQRALAEILELEDQLTRVKDSVKDSSKSRTRYEKQDGDLRKKLEPLRLYAEKAEKVAEKFNGSKSLKEKASAAVARERRAASLVREVEVSLASEQRAVDAISARRERLAQTREEHNSLEEKEEELWAKEEEELRAQELDASHKRDESTAFVEMAAQQTVEAAEGYDQEMERVNETHQLLVQAMQEQEEQIRETMAMFELDGKQAVDELGVFEDNLKKYVSSSIGAQ